MKKTGVTVVAFLFIILMGFSSVLVQAQLPTPPSGYKTIPLPDTAPPSGVWPKGDANTGRVQGDVPAPAHTNDWRLHRQEDDQGNDVELWVINETNVIYYALIFSNATGRYLVGKCPFGGGRNWYAKAGTEDTDKSGKPDQITGTWWRSRDPTDTTVPAGQDPNDDDGDGKEDAWAYTFNVSTNKVTADHYENGVKQADSVPPKEPKIAPFTFGDLPPVNPGVNYTYGETMYPEAVGVGGVLIPVGKLALLAPYIVFAVAVAVAAMSVAVYRKKYRGF